MIYFSSLSAVSVAKIQTDTVHFMIYFSSLSAVRVAKIQTEEFIS